ncbi:hypothetical protein EF910_16120 [Streptomyces sp. WAC07149]|uniref:hypothetical protein n=1 Tax=Streptomyces sp. WAC07149 TaxID=2487425 RepID=UPI000F78A150|nr:hypothetical protein [Streptomyces sp. WAC07149]RST04542.1 hypothetical protein EF910_16120 [Streptomyces sp. WAC07149]
MSHHSGWGQHPQQYGPQWGGGWIQPPPQPGVIPLRPLGPGEMVGGAFKAFRQYWKPLVGVMLAVQGAGFLLVVAAAVIGVAAASGSFAEVFAVDSDAHADSSDVATVFLALLPAGVILLLVMLLGTAAVGALCPAVVQEAVLGRTTTFRDMWRRTWSRLPSVLGAVFLTGLIAGGPAVLIYAIGIPLTIMAWDGSGTPAGVLLLVLAALSWMPVAAWLAVRFSLAPAAAVFEDLRPVAALRRSAALVKGGWWRVFGVTLLAYLVGMAGGYAIQMPFGLVGVLALFPSMLDSGAGDGVSATMVIGLIVYLACLLLGTVVSALFQLGYPQLVVSLLYVDQRMRNENLAPALVTAAYGGRTPGQDPASP